ncbi:metabotropic glutamate receptor 6-like [Babylonia areolata]|uniref:metabotropic glutamate receptor 6-like n=1 Tax=Babylonia areolata TaxID=304850 RepID=UPI003FD08CFA
MTVEPWMMKMGLWRTVGLWMIRVSWITVGWTGVLGGFIVPGLPAKKFVKLGDINIGVLVPMSRYDRVKRCSEQLSLAAVHYTQGVEYAVDKVNAMRQLPGNVTLGFVVLDDCYKESVAVAQSLAFVPQTQCLGQEVSHRAASDVLGAYDVVAVIGSFLSSQSVAVSHLLGPAQVPLVSFTSTSDDLTNKALFPYFLRITPPDSRCIQVSHRAASDVLGAYDVVAVIGSFLSSQSVAVSHLLGPAQVPLVSFTSTSDDLTNKALFPYFLRITPPDRLQFRAIFSLIQRLGWSYVSVIYMQGSYGENGFKQLRDLFDTHGICLAAVHKVPTRMTDREAEAVAKNLVLHRNARAVVIITAFTNARKVIQEAGKLVPAGTFTWVGCDGWASALPQMQHLGDTLLDTFHTTTHTAPVPDYLHYFQRLRLTDTEDPWFAEFWDQSFNCSAANGTCDTNTTVGASGLPSLDFNFSGHLLDTVSVLTSAVSRVLRSSECSGVLDPSAARKCVTGPRLLDQLLATRQQGHTGWIELDSNGDRQGRYVIKQVVPRAALQQQSRSTVYDQVTVAEFDALTNELSLVRNINWHHALRGGSGAEEAGRPESRCSYPCGPHQARVVQEVTCCWLCQPCRVNERLILHGTRCDPCPLFTWPDPGTENTTCRPISPDRPRVDSVAGSVQISFALRHRHRRVIKASSKELSFLMLLAIGLGYLTMATLVAPPTDVTCRMNFLFFCVSFTLIYAPLFVRTLRIFRIFEASKRSAQQPRLVDSSHQLIFSFVLLSVQVVMCGVVMLVFSTWHKRTQHSVHEQLVELTCDLPLSGLACSLAYNLLLVASCTLLAFKTRHLPDNFNESRFISMCVSTTMVILVCFMPAYLVSSREMLKMLTLALVLALNHSVALVFLFLPKIYAVLYLEDRASRAIHSSTFPSQTRSVFTLSTSSSSTSNPGASHVPAGGAAVGERGDDASTGQPHCAIVGSNPRPRILKVRPATCASSDM